MAYNYKSDLSKAKNLGSSGDGVRHWWHQRLSAVLLLLLTVWLFYFAHSMKISNIANIIDFFQKPYNVIAVILFVGTGLYHGMLGIESVIQDYINCRILRLIALLLTQFFLLVTAVSFFIAIFYVIIL